MNLNEFIKNLIKANNKVNIFIYKLDNINQRIFSFRIFNQIKKLIIEKEEIIIQNIPGSKRKLYIQ